MLKHGPPVTGATPVFESVNLSLSPPNAYQTKFIFIHGLYIGTILIANVINYVMIVTSYKSLTLMGVIKLLAKSDSPSFPIYTSVDR